MHSKQVRATLAALTAVALLPGLLRAAPASADDTTPAVLADRSLVVQAWQSGGLQLRAEAEIALTGTDDQVRDFLGSGLSQAQTLDQRDAVEAAIGDGGPAVRAAAQQALTAADGGDTTALATFLNTGRDASENIDLRLRVDQVKASGGAQVQEAAQVALDSEDPVVLQEFLDSGWQTQWQTDLRLQVNQVQATGGTEVKAAAQKALDNGSAEALDQFLTYGWDVASAHDDETASLVSLLEQAEQAETTVERETKNTQDQAKRASDGANAARRSAQEAAAATASAKSNAAKAAAHAKRAAAAARKAAASAQVAIDAAGAADRAAQVATAAAQRVSRAAAQAASAASKAYTAAAAAAYDRTKTGEARKAAEAAAAIARTADALADKAGKAGEALANAKLALDYATDAAKQSTAAADANDDAQEYAQDAGADAAEARAAAKLARANAERATRAAAAAQKYLQVAITNAFAARDAAKAAAADARAAAAAAQDAADHAVDAAQAATNATNYAKAAEAAATKVVQLGNDALAVYTAARAADTERLAVATDAALESARDASTTYEALATQADWDVEQAAKRDAETQRLIAEAQSPLTDPALAVVDARKVALALGSSDAEATRAAALEALQADDTGALAFVRTGLAAAAVQDNRVAVADLAGSTDNAALATAALTALAGTDAQVAEFLRTQNYSGRFTQDRLKVNQILSAARTASRTVTVQRAQTALDTGTLQALRDFLDKGQYTASAIDDRVQVNQLIANVDTGAEVKAAAQVALESPAINLPEFLRTGQYTAAERDYDTAVHLSVVGGLLEKINEVGTIAVQHAQEAQSAAAKARGDATKASEYATQAIASAAKAADYATSASAWASKAATSASQAAKSAATAKGAAVAANQSARTATRAATWATSLHEYAVKVAAEAKKWADQAKKSAADAGADAKAAQAAGDAARKEYLGQRNAEISNCVQQYTKASTTNFEQFWLGTTGGTARACVANLIADPQEMAQRAYQNEAYCDTFYPQGMQSQFYQNCLHTVLNPEFRWMTMQDFATLGIQGITAVMLPGVVALGAICVITIVCGMAVGEILGVADTGLNLYKFIKGDQTLADTLLNFGENILQTILFKGLVKLTSVTFRNLKVLYDAGKSAEIAQKRLDAADLNRINLDVVLACSLVSGAVPNSFSAGTRVLLDGGASKPIAQIGLGDRVRATDPVARAGTSAPVVGLIESDDTELADLTVREKSGPVAVVHTTGHHPFWDAAAGQWVEAGDLAPGTALSTSDGDGAQVDTVRTFTGSETMYNLTVADLHTYYVQAGDEWVLVHNAPKCGRAPAGHVYKGGLYKNLKDPLTGNNVTGTEINHMPAKQALMEAFGLTESQAESNGLAIQMDEADHVKTESWGSSHAGKQHRAEQIYWIKRGYFAKAMRMDLENIKMLFPNGKYDAAVDEMMDHYDEFIDYLKAIGKL
ncbi:hypothetical protein GCM10010435_14550 [Winogradskya consettensis]|uniref:Intein C-terminal splicing domain-containing protein n=1 Tax=Winogradskya consettensis TaxID=113560 RepID=A0A919SCH5_9ACTN|nr:polymorphic toxin-type HINT domain-containing protein [Actinoplanes consettensis]GIM69122.1 hypothetical protein Aco04nite_13820 [Actinoplanes consettensis]